MRSKSRVFVAVAAIAVIGPLGITSGALHGAEILKLGAPLAATGADAREGALAKQGYDLWAETVNAHGGIRAGGQKYKVEIVYYYFQKYPVGTSDLSAALTNIKAAGAEVARERRTPPA